VTGGGAGGVWRGSRSVPRWWGVGVALPVGSPVVGRGCCAPGRFPSAPAGVPYDAVSPRLCPGCVPRVRVGFRARPRLRLLPLLRCCQVAPLLALAFPPVGFRLVGGGGGLRLLCRLPPAGGCPGSLVCLLSVVAVLGSPVGFFPRPYPPTVSSPPSVVPFAPLPSPSLILIIPFLC